jgi:hypothetical protein
MEAYPKDFVEHNLPLIILSGLQAQSDLSKDVPDRSRNPLLDGGFWIRTDAAPVTGPTAERLFRAFLSADSSDTPWNSQATPKRTDIGGSFRIKSVGRVGQTPSRALPEEGLPALACTTRPPPELTDYVVLCAPSTESTTTSTFPTFDSD